jgi:hypothetical protein
MNVPLTKSNTNNLWGWEVDGSVLRSSPTAGQVPSGYSSRQRTVISWLSGSDTLTTVSVLSDVELEVLTAVVMIVVIVWDIVFLNPYVNRRFEEIDHLHLQGRKSALQETSVRQVARPTRHHIPEDGNINFISLLLFILSDYLSDVTASVV